MLRDPIEIEIASRARQPGIRNPRRPRSHFENVLADFLGDELLQGKRLLDLGPGQWDFAELARERGAQSITGIDNDEAVVELGLYKGFDAVLGDLRDLDAALGPFDGVFCKFSINAFWAATDEDAAAYARSVAVLGGWAWIAPWNGAPASFTGDVERRLAAQTEGFASCGFEVIQLSDEQTQRYGVTGTVANHPLFVRLP